MQMDKKEVDRSLNVTDAILDLGPGQVYYLSILDLGPRQVHTMEKN